MVIGMGLSLYEGDMEVGQEYKVGTITISGTTYDRYVKIVDCGALPNNNATYTTANINAVGVLSLSGVANSTASKAAWPMLCIDLVTYNNSIELSINGDGNIKILTKANWSMYNAIVTVEYYR